MRDNGFLKRLRKKAKKGRRGWPLATIAFYGPNLSQAALVRASVRTRNDSREERLGLRRYAVFDPASGKLSPADNCGVEKSGDRSLRDPRGGETAKGFRAQSSRASDLLKASRGNPAAEIVLSKPSGGGNAALVRGG